VKTEPTIHTCLADTNSVAALNGHARDFVHRLAARCGIERPMRHPSHPVGGERPDIGWADRVPAAVVETAVLIRRAEAMLLELFSGGRLHGTVHTCIGQEFSAVAFAAAMSDDDIVCSNHRCHGHYIALTNDCDGLVAELMGKTTGPCGGVGGSQHLCTGRFFSNGIQGGMVPVAAGMALASKLRGQEAIVTAFIGDGTLGEGIVYETLNIASIESLPLLIVCENNFYAQSTPQDLGLAGDIAARGRAFEVKTFAGTTDDPAGLMDVARLSVEYVRTRRRPAFCTVDTWRISPHSKGDDHRDAEELAHHAATDPLNQFQQSHPDLWASMRSRADATVQTAVDRAEAAPRPKVADYLDGPGSMPSVQWKPADRIERRQGTLINEFFLETMQQDASMLFIGEDVLDPYGGAFKVAAGLSEAFPQRVFSTPISEAAITGIANGLALAGFRPYVEIMFGDFITLSLDQIINHASKFHHMYNRQVQCPVVIRTPMGGRRCYGPTHSQTLDKLLLGIDNVTVIALNRLVDPRHVYRSIHHHERHPVVVIENKTDYARRIGDAEITGYSREQTVEDYPTTRIRPIRSRPTLTVVAYGGAADIAIDGIDLLFDDLDFKTELLVPSKIHPLDLGAILESVRTTGRLLVVEEGSAFAGLGAEIIASAAETLGHSFTARRVAAKAVPIPAAAELEDCVLPGVADILTAARQLQ